MSDPNESIDPESPEATSSDPPEAPSNAQTDEGEGADGQGKTQQGGDDSREENAAETDDSQGDAAVEKEGGKAVPPPRRKQRDDRPRIIARYGLLGMLGEFTYTKKTSFQPGDMLVLQTDRGIEIGQHVPMLNRRGPRLSADMDQVRDYVHRSGGDYLHRRGGRVLRAATEQDLSEERHISIGAHREQAYCEELVAQHNLPMKLIACEHLFGGERVVFYFSAEGRVDFRELVRDLAKQYQTRIEMRQVGARDEARLVADYEICGRQCCCKSFLKTLRPVSMKMAKTQKATLDPTKVSGRCGRLRCCLRFEHEVYEELVHHLPRNNAWVRTADGEGKVVDRQIITQLVTVQLSDQRRITYPVEEIEVLAQKPPQPEADGGAASEPPDSARARGGRRAGRGRRGAAPAEQDSPRSKQPATDPGRGRRHDEGPSMASPEEDASGQADGNRADTQDGGRKQPPRRRSSRRRDVAETRADGESSVDSAPKDVGDVQQPTSDQRDASAGRTSEGDDQPSTPDSGAKPEGQASADGTQEGRTGKSRRRRRRRRPKKGGGGNTPNPQQGED